jgi:DNA-binding CsgD family transcriptional regulator
MKIDAVDVLRIEAERLKIPTLKHLGLRFFFSNGDVVAQSTCSEWNNYLEEADKLLEKRHYTSELTIGAIQNTYCVIRQDNLTSPYISALKDFGMSSSLIIYQRLKTVIVGYYFIPQVNNYCTLQYLLNNLSVLQNLIRNVGCLINSGRYSGKKITIDQKYKLLDLDTAKALLNINAPLIKHSTRRKFLISGYEYDFTPKEIEILTLLRYTSVAKEITVHLNKNIDLFQDKEISTRTVEWHIQNIRKKTQITSNLDLRNIAIEIVKLI